MESTRPKSLSSPDDQVRFYGQTLWECVGREAARADEGAWFDTMLDRALRDGPRKNALLKLIDVLPALNDAATLAKHVESYLTDDARVLPAWLRAPVKLAASKPFQEGLAALVRAQVQHVAQRFIVGRAPEQAVVVLRTLWEDGFAFTADLLGEKTLSEREADRYFQRYRELINALSEETAHWPEKPVLERDRLGPIPRANVSVKLSALAPALNPADPAGVVARLKERTLPLLLHAQARNVFVNFDAEESTLLEITQRVFEECAMHGALRSWRHLGIVVQAYRQDALECTERLVAFAKRRGTPFTVRLVKGAYWDYDTAIALQEGRPSPLFSDKESTDANFERVAGYLLENAAHVRAAIASHNLRSLSSAILSASRLNVPNDDYEVQMLYGMAPAEQRALRNVRHRVRLYTPIGELIPGMAYLVRRLLENTSNDGFLRLAFQEEADMEKLLKRPRLRLVASRPDRKRRPDAHPFENCPLLDFSSPKERDRFADAVAMMPVTFPRRVPVVVDGHPETKAEGLEQLNPSDTTILVTQVSQASGDDVDKAVASALGAAARWNARPLEERALCIESLAAELEETRLELAALEVYEVGKTWREADADVAEAIDFCRYYARQARRELAPQPIDSPPGESNQIVWEGYGPTAVIAPWNFPIAILCGMSAAALVSGNPVLMKPAEQSSACAYVLFRAMQTAGIPREVVQFLPGPGEETGRCLVSHPDVAVVAFTGSMEVGLSILESAAHVSPGQSKVKRVICEMGGKNAIIVDDDADLDEAVSGVIESAFNYAGQKCSACSRAILVGAIAETFTDRLIGAAQRLQVAPANEPGSEIPPVIDATAYARLMSLIGDPGTGAELLHTGIWRQGGYFVPPTIFRVADPQHTLMQRELFGPVLTLYAARDFDEALEIAVHTPYALTGGLYSRNPRHIAIAREKFRTGNFYINRPCTGARVGRQPFGGFGMSGTGSKAGGTGYLGHFAVQRCITENTMRKGFTPEL